MIWKISILKIKSGIAGGICKEGFMVGSRGQPEETVASASAMQISPLCGFLGTFLGGQGRSAHWLNRSL